MAIVKKPKSGSKIPKAQGGRLLRKIADKIVSKRSNRIVDKVVKRSAGMTDKPVDYGKVVLTDAQKAKNAEILNRSKTTYVDKLRQEKIAQAEKATARNKAAFQAKLDAVKKNNPKKRMGGMIKKAKDGMWMQKAASSIKRRGTEGKCTPITKPGCTGRAKALAKTFKKIAKSNKKK
jgi:hypothetical protein